MSARVFDRVLARRARHFAPFFVLGDPDLETSLALITDAIEAGVRMIEIGLPYSDPVADGPEIQMANRRAAGGPGVRERLRRLSAHLAGGNEEVAINLLVYGNLVHGIGAGAFVEAAAGAGVASLLCPDLGFEEGRGLAARVRAAGLHPVELIGPRTTSERRAEIAASRPGFVYLTGRQGVTGEGRGGQTLTEEGLREIAETLGVPLAVGFGLRGADDLRAVFAGGARIGIIGSAIARRIRGEGSVSSPMKLRARVRALIEDGQKATEELDACSS